MLVLGGMKAKSLALRPPCKPSSACCAVGSTATEVVVPRYVVNRNGVDALTEPCTGTKVGNTLAYGTKISYVVGSLTLFECSLGTPPRWMKVHTPDSVDGQPTWVSAEGDNAPYGPNLSPNEPLASGTPAYRLILVARFMTPCCVDWHLLLGQQVHYFGTRIFARTIQADRGRCVRLAGTESSEMRVRE